MRAGLAGFDVRLEARLTDRLAGFDARFDARVADRLAAETAPALAVGVFRGGTLTATALHGTIESESGSGGVGDGRFVDGGRGSAGRTPQADTAFRIASCTKSFTAAAVLILRDRGMLDLDSGVAEHLPYLRLLGPGEDMSSGPLTLRMLLTMSGGLPADDPWADRLESMSFAGLQALLGAGVRLVRTPGTAYEYSNLGYAMLGAVISAVSGREYTDFVRAELLAPLGLRSTGFDAGVPAAGGVARGYCRRGSAWEVQPFSTPGAFSAIGGLFSTLADLGRWAEWLADGFTGGGEAAGQPLNRASRREMQQLHRVAGPETLEPAGADGGDTGQPAGTGVGGYGFGLRILEDPRRGLIVGHSGGYPGFSSHMTWHPASRTAVIGFENASYAKVGALVRGVLADALQAPFGTAPGNVPGTAAGTVPGASAQNVAGTVPGRAAGVVPWAEVLAARAVVERLVLSWHDELGRSIFAGNVELDEPLADRRRRLEEALADAGPLQRVPRDAGFSATAARLEWLMPGTRGALKCALSMTPEAHPRVQELSFAFAPSSAAPEPGGAAASAVAPASA
ncbi:serine hydrolase domain-containing protein [Arthrobacter sp. CG_A4]|uniref:serine hydrolase domain-containing protein n=1 Tax=Arthrobacter sp. CG_A4 TaxID=3071706 RepID=UPI002E08FC0A|nr:CubicO group peptidase (beta-lactamase class C family) [Arthrobacter sp. CG_A4]